jgi:DnaJ domain
MKKAILTPLNEKINEKISQIALEHSIAIDILEDFANFVIKNHKIKPIKPLSLSQLKESVCKYFQVKGTPALKKDGSYQMATEGMNLNLGLKESWEILYRKFIGLLPHEEGEKGADCINGINIFKYFMPWRVFGLDPQSASDQDIKNSYRNLSKIYHPDNPETGNARIFDRVNSMYQSITVKIS